MNYVNGDIVDLQKGNAQIIAETIAEEVEADIFEVVRKEAYPQGYRDCVASSSKELKEDARPALVNTLDSIDAYDTVFVVGPCWYAHYPLPLATQLEHLDFHGKTVHYVMSHEGSGLGESLQDLTHWCKGATLGKGLAVHGTDASRKQDEIRKWAKELTK